LKRLLLSVLLLSTGLITSYLILVPDVTMLKKEHPKITSFMEYREREWKAKVKKYRVKQIWVSLSSISPYLVKAVLIAEDDKFCSHEGFDYEQYRRQSKEI